MSNTAKEKYRHDYRVNDYLIPQTDLTFELFDEYTLVSSTLKFERHPDVADNPAKTTLDGEQIELLEIFINGEPLEKTAYEISDTGLTLINPPQSFTLMTRGKLLPHQNTSLEGLYQSNKKYCTQCEAEGFRKITYFYDRPDVLSTFSVRIEADAKRYPYLLSNGNPVEKGTLSDGRHFASWHDPFPKPSYLFALVAGNLDLLEDSFKTQSGREVALQLYVDPGKLDQSEYAMQSLKRAMQWDEQRFGLEYDLDLYMIVAVGDFNMGAMENKGLNIFNTKYVLANAKTASDADFEHIESVIGHEYFHNWTGNRVTCRDWFQLSLKEGLTVFRDQEFTRDLRSAAVKRIDDVKVIRGYQFSEDAGPMAHPIRPESYVEMNNFYTVTVYNKGAEVIRMMHSLLGESGFQHGMKTYFSRHDGQAVTCEDFVSAMVDANQKDLKKFRHWYEQAGTPSVDVVFEYLADKQQLILKATQSNEHPTAKKPYHIPIRVGLIDSSGKTLHFSIEGEETRDEVIVELSEYQQTFVLSNVASEPVPSIFRDFSAPVKSHIPLDDQQLSLLFAHDNDLFNRWDAGQQLMMRAIVTPTPATTDTLIAAFESLLRDQSADHAFCARALQLPDHKSVFESGVSISIDELILSRKALELAIAERLQQLVAERYQSLHVTADESLNAADAGRRAFKNVLLHYLALVHPKSDEWTLQQFDSAQLMTEQQSALSAAVKGALDCQEQVLKQFYTRWHEEALVMDKWLSIQAMQDQPNTIEQLTKLLSDPVYSDKNPNKVRAVYGAFASGNFVQFHHQSGSGYRFIANAIERLDPLNPQVAASLAKQFSMAPRLDSHRRVIVRDCLQHILLVDGLSADVTEVVSKTLEQLKAVN